MYLPQTVEFAYKQDVNPCNIVYDMDKYAIAGVNLLNNPITMTNIDFSYQNYAPELANLLAYEDNKRSGQDLVVGVFSINNTVALQIIYQLFTGEIVTSYLPVNEDVNNPTLIGNSQFVDQQVRSILNISVLDTTRILDININQHQLTTVNNTASFYVGAFYIENGFPVINNLSLEYNIVGDNLDKDKFKLNIYASLQNPALKNINFRNYAYILDAPLDFGIRNKIEKINNLSANSLVLELKYNSDQQEEVPPFIASFNLLQTGGVI